MTVQSGIEKKFRVNGIDINYVKIGSGGKAVILMPGALGSWKTDFGPQLKHLPNILCDYTIVGWDPPGYGKSIPPKRNFTTDIFENDAIFAHKLMEGLSFGKYSILGWSDGGITGMIQAGKYPAAVERLVIWGANAYIAPEEIKIYESIRDVSRWSEKMRLPMEEMYGKEEFPKLWSAWIDVCIKIYTDKNGNLCKDFLKDIICPTLIVHGEKDPMLLAEHVPYLLKNIKQAKLFTFPEGKHNVHLRYFEEFNKIVAKFLGE
ncbi:valacyclovir hydrolase-like [Sergentomyia squamirostris]